MDEIDIWRVADHLVKEYGEKAVFIAALRADVLFGYGEMERCSAWVRIVRAIKDLNRQKAGASELIN